MSTDDKIQVRLDLTLSTAIRTAFDPSVLLTGYMYGKDATGILHEPFFEIPPPELANLAEELKLRATDIKICITKLTFRR